MDPFAEYLELWTASEARSASAGGRTSERDLNVPVPAAPFLGGMDDMSSYLGALVVPQQTANRVLGPSYRVNTSTSRASRTASARLPSKITLPFSPMFAPATGTLPASKPTESSSAPLSPPPSGAPSSSGPDFTYVPPNAPDAPAAPDAPSLVSSGSSIHTNADNPPATPTTPTETTSEFPWWILLLLAGGWYVARQRQANTAG